MRTHTGGYQCGGYQCGRTPEAPMHHVHAAACTGKQGGTACTYPFAASSNRIPPLPPACAPPLLGTPSTQLCARVTAARPVTKPRVGPFASCSGMNATDVRRWGSCIFIGGPCVCTRRWNVVWGRCLGVGCSLRWFLSECTVVDARHHALLAHMHEIAAPPVTYCECRGGF